MYRSVVFWLASTLLFQSSRGTGTVSVILSFYNNSKGLGNNGNCCERIPGICNGGNRCDHYFIVCLDRSRESNNDTNQCDIGRYRTGTIIDRNEITFGSSIGGTPNPNELHFQTWMVTFVIKVQVWDDDDSMDDPVDLLITRVNMEASRSRAEMEHRSFTVKRRTQLDLKLAVFCDENWYHPHCDIYCNPSLGNYSCGSKGEKVCISGLTGENCTQTISNCASGPCFKPGGMCVDKNDGYICECKPGYTGPLCKNQAEGSEVLTALTPSVEGHGSNTGFNPKVAGITIAVLVLVIVIIVSVNIWKVCQKRKH